MKKLIFTAGMLLSVSQAAHAQNLPDIAGTAMKKVTGGITGALGAIFNPVESGFYNAVHEQRWNDALLMYEKNSEVLRKTKDLGTDVQSALAVARERNAGDVKRGTESLRKLCTQKAYLQGLREYVAAVRALETADQEYRGKLRILSDFADSDPALMAAKTERQNAMAALRADLSATYGGFPHERELFREALGDTVEEGKLFAENIDGLLNRFGTDDDSDARGLINNTSAAWRTDPTLKTAVANTVWKRIVSSSRSAIAMVSAMEKVRSYGLTPDDVPARPRVLVYNAATAGEAAVKVTSLDGSITSPLDLSGENGPLVILYVAESESRRNIVDKQEISSTYKSGTRSIPNAAYAVAQMDCQTAQTNYAAQQARNQLAPARNLLGAVLQGVSEGIVGANVKQICDRFAATSPYNDEDLFSPYKYTVTQVEITKRARGRILSVNSSDGTIDSYPLTFEDKKAVKVAYGRKAEDNSSMTDQILDSDLEKLAAAPIEIDGAVCVRDAASMTPEPHKRVELVALLDKPEGSKAATLYAPSGAPAAPQLVAAGAQPVQMAYGLARPVSDALSSDIRMQSVVVVLNPKGTMGAGFYVEPNSILTNYHVVEGASTVEIRALDGNIYTGNVGKRDIGLDLALIHVERSGPAVQFSNSILKVGQTVEAIGHPQGFFFSISRGIVSAVREMKGVLAPGAGKALLIQTDAAINSGNSGGPLFQGDKVVGVNTIKFKGAQGLGFAVHYSEVLKFLSQ